MSKVLIFLGFSAVMIGLILVKDDALGSGTLVMLSYYLG